MIMLKHYIISADFCFIAKLPNFLRLAVFVVFSVHSTWDVVDLYSLGGSGPFANSISSLSSSFFVGVSSSSCIALLFNWSIELT